MAMFDQHAQRVNAQYNAEHITIYAQATPRPVDPDTLAAAARQLAALPLEAIPDPALLPPGSRMPLRRNPLFVGREVDLWALATALKGVKPLRSARRLRPRGWAASARRSSRVSSSTAMGNSLPGACIG
jgi:hypothetical protein